MLSVFQSKNLCQYYFLEQIALLGVGKDLAMDKTRQYSGLSGGFSVVSVAVAINQLFDFTSSHMFFLQMDTASVLVFPLLKTQEYLASRSIS